MEPNYRCPKCEHYYFVDRMGKTDRPCCPNDGTEMLTYEEWQERKKEEERIPSNS